MHFSDTHSRRLIGGISLIAGPALVLAAWSLFPAIDSTSTSSWVSDVVDDPTRWAFAAWLMMVGVAVSVMAYLALVHLLREHQPVIGDVGGAFAIGGSVFLGGLLGLALAEIEAIRQLGDTEATVATVEAVDESAGGLFLAIGPLLMSIGLLALAYGLYRARTAPQPLAAALAVGAVLQAVGATAFITPLAIAGSALMFVALGGIGMQLLREPDEAWERAPTYEGFHAVAA